jgi:DNA invertase Pin-like site-specific DNA recombinase
MNIEKLQIAYERLSRDDEQQGESNSITNQKMLLDDYAAKNGYTNLTHLTDDGWSGTRWDRPGIMKLIEEVERGNVEVVLVKDMSRLGRDHLRVGLLLEQFREYGVRFIAINENIDTEKGEDDFMPFRNIINEWTARETSRKIRAINEARTKSGKHVTGAIIYGYIHDPEDRQKWLLDEEAAQVVKRIYRSVIEGKGVEIIANELTADNILTPAAHWQKIGAGMKKIPNTNPCKWAAATVINILRREEYMGWCVLNKTVKETYKSKRKENDPDKKLIFKNAFPQIIDEETWSVIQRLRETRRRPQKVGGEPNPLTGVLFCADCGHKLYNKLGKADKYHKPHDEYVCSSYRHYSRSCTYHYIRTEVIERIILESIKRVSRYVRENEGIFVERVREASALQKETAMKASKRKLTQTTRRRDEVSGMLKKLYESYINEKIPENHFKELLADYDTERSTLDSEITKLQYEIDSYNTDTVRTDKFIELVKSYTEFNEFSAVLLNEFISKVIVHEAIRTNGIRTQEIEIFFSFIGKFDVPLTPEEIAEQEKPVIRTSRKKLRSEMTEEERTHARQLDHERYARKVAARKAAEQAVRAEILQGTPFAV